MMSNNKKKNRLLSLSTVSLLALSMMGCTVGDEPVEQLSALEDGLYDARLSYGSQEIEATIEKSGEAFLMGDDIMIDPGQILQIDGGPDTGNVSISMNSALTNPSRHWPKGRIPYTVDATFSADAVKDLLASMKIWESHANVHFVPKEVGDVAFVDIEKNTESICSSYIGMTGSAQILRLDEKCGRAPKLHELGHVLGFYHTQSRTDREDYIQINWDNIEVDKEHNFLPIVHSSGSYHEGSYSTESIMHYGSYVFAEGDLPAIQKRTSDGSLEDIPYNRELHSSDIQAAIDTYGKSLVGTFTPVEEPGGTPKPTPNPTPTFDNCDYTHADSNNGWGWDSIGRKSCPPR